MRFFRTAFFNIPYCLITLNRQFPGTFLLPFLQSFFHTSSTWNILSQQSGHITLNDLYIPDHFPAATDRQIETGFQELKRFEQFISATG